MYNDKLVVIWVFFGIRFWQEKEALPSVPLELRKLRTQKMIYLTQKTWFRLEASSSTLG